MAKTVAETIREITQKHMDQNQGYVIGQCLSAVGWVLNTVPPRIKDTKYTPLSLRQEKPYAILWLLKRYPTELSSSQIAKLTGSTKNTVDNIRNGTYREAILETKSPMDIGLCSYLDLEKALNRSKNKKQENDTNG